jgi:hypothetical protein
MRDEYARRMTNEVAGGTFASWADSGPALEDELRFCLEAGNRALEVDGDLHASRHYFERAYQLAEQSGDVRAIALSSLGLAGLWVSECRTAVGGAQREERLRRALSALESTSVLALRIRARLAGEADYSRGESGAIRVMLDEVRAGADPVLLAEVLSLAHHCLLGPEHVRLRGELADELIRVSISTQRRSDLLMGLLWRTFDSFTRGDSHAERLLNELRDQLSQRSHLAVGFIVSAIDVMLAIRSGNLDQAEALVEVCARSGAAAGDIDKEWWPGAQLVAIRWYQGRLVELLPMLRDQVHSPSLSVVDNSSVAALAVAAAQAGDVPAAASALASLCGSDLGNLARSSSWLVTMYGVVEAAYLLNDTDVAARAYELLSPWSGLPMVGGLGMTCFGSTEHALGVASVALGQLDRAIDHLRAAVKHNLALAHWPAVLASRQRLALACTLRGAPADAGAARRELDAARGEAARLGLPLPGGVVPGLDRASATCERLGKQWRLSFQNRSITVDSSIGMVHLAVLIANPRTEISAVDLVAGLAALSDAAGDGGAGHPVLDRAAVAEYKRRLSALDAEISQPESGNDAEHHERARAERDWLIAELAGATGLRGRARAFPDQPERARVAVGKAIRRAVARVAESDAFIGEHLRQAVRTGMRCSYWPD